MGRSEAGSGSSGLIYAHEVLEPNESTGGIVVLANTLELNGGTIRSAASDADAVIEFEIVAAPVFDERPRGREPSGS